MFAWRLVNMSKQLNNDRKGIRNRFSNGFAGLLSEKMFDVIPYPVKLVERLLIYGKAEIFEAPPDGYEVNGRSTVRHIIYATLTIRNWFIPRRDQIIHIRLRDGPDQGFFSE